MRIRIAAVAALLVMSMLALPRPAAAEPPCESPTPPDWCYAPDPVNDAQFVSQSPLADAVIAGRTFFVTVKMRNVGNTTWRPGTFKLAYQVPQTLPTWGTDLQSTVPPGAIATFSLSIDPPQAVGVHTLQWRMVEQGVGSFGEATPATTVKVDDKWNLGEDMARQEVSPPALRDEYGNTDVWSFASAEAPWGGGPPWSLGHMTYFVADFSNLTCWRWYESEDALPSVCQNWRTDNPRPFGVDWAPGTVLMHPAPHSAAVAVWRVPYGGRIRIEGGVRDLHAACGDGFRWSLWHGNQGLASGVVANGGEMPFSSGRGAASLNDVWVYYGERIELRIDAGAAGDHGCDSTGVVLTIRMTYAFGIIG